MSRQHPSRTGRSRWIGCNYRSNDNLRQDLADRRIANPLTQSLVITLPKKINLQQCQNYRTISLISHPRKVVLKIILNGLKPQAEQIITEEQAGLRAGRSTTEQIFSLRILYEKYLQHQHEPLPCPHRLQEGLRQGLVCSFMAVSYTHLTLPTTELV